MKCFTCGKLGHMSCPKCNPTRKKGAQIAQVEDGEVHTPTMENVPKIEEALLLKRTLLKPVK